MTTPKIWLLALFCVAANIISFDSISQNVSGDIKTIHVKFREKFLPKDAIAGRTTNSGMPKMDALNEKHGALNIRRVFPEAGKFEAAHRAHGLHLWYEITFNKETTIKNVISDYSKTEYFDQVEERHPYKAIGKEGRVVMREDDFTLPSGTNDPKFKGQWNFDNRGQTGGTLRADINLLNAWRIETGSTDVIVAVIDGGIDVTHPDIASSLWTNYGEIPNNNRDDDGNGYVDDVHGYGFGDRIPTIFPDAHATHVAGIIAATTNNGVGVAGIAGGDGTGNGVRLMTCAGFGIYGIGNFEAAMVYAADNGAVISQNSWIGGTNSIEAAIDYFVNRAGLDNTEGNFDKNIQTGPMAGGLVIFAAGNDNTSSEAPAYPATYSKVMAVASTDKNDRRSYFSNYGSWVDIAAPGENILSTTGGAYGYLSGTSMACPHVSGVAALMVSNFKSSGLTPSQVWNRIRIGATSIDDQNPSYIGMLGAGRLDALRALRQPDAIPPATIADLSITEMHYSSAILEWTAVGENGNDGQAAEFDIRYSVTLITESTFNSATRVTDAPVPPPSGTRVRFEITGLSPQQSYYFAIKSIDVFYNASAAAFVSATSPPAPKLELITQALSEQLFPGGIADGEILIKNTGGDELIVRPGVSVLDEAIVGSPGYTRGRLFAINILLNTIEELDPKTGEVMHSIPLPERSSQNYEGLAFDGSYLYYGQSRTIYKIEPTTGAVLRTIKVLTAFPIKGLAWAGHYLYVSSTELLEVDSDNEKVVRHVPFTQRGISGGGNRSTIFAAGTDELSELDRSTFIVKHSFPIKAARGISYSNTENILFVAVGSGIEAVNPDDGSMLYSFPYPTTTAIAADEYAPAWFLDEDQLIKVPAGETASIPVQFIATDLAAIQLTGTAKVIAVNVDSPSLNVSLTLNVASGTDIDFVNKLDLGTQYIGYPIDTVIQIENRGNADLLVTDIHTDDARVTTSLSSVTLKSGERAPITISVASNDQTSINTNIIITSNDPDEGILSIPVTANISAAPAIELNPTTLSATLAANEQKTLHFTATNTGGSPLSWRSSASTGLPVFDQASVEPPMIQSLRPTQSNVGDIVLKAESLEPLGTLAYDEESGMIYATSVVSNTLYSYDIEKDEWTNAGVTPDLLPYNGIAINGKLYYATSQLHIYSILSHLWSSVAFPIEGVGGGITSDGQDVYVVLGSVLYKYDPLAGIWLQLAAAPGHIYNGGGLSFHSGVIFAHQSATRVVGSGTGGFYKYYLETDTWTTSMSLPTVASPGSAVDPSSMRYFVLGSAQNNANAYIQMSVFDIRQSTWSKEILPFDVGQSSGTLVYVGRPGVSGIYFCQGSGVKFARYETLPANNWISITPTKGELAPGASQNFDINLDPTVLVGGTYHETITISGSRPKLSVSLPLEITVAGTPDISIDPTSIDFGPVLIGEGRSRNIKISNTGTAALIVSSVTIDHPEFSISETSFQLPVGESILVTVTFNPTVPGKMTGTYVFKSNDPDEGEKQFTFTGDAGTIPVIDVSPSSLSVDLLSGQSTTRTFTLTYVDGLSTYISGQPSVFEGTLVGGTEPKIVAPGEPVTVTVDFDAFRRAGGTYTTSIQFLTEVPTAYVAAEVPVTVTVTDAPDLDLDKTKIDFGDQFIRYGAIKPVTITNNGTLPLTISSVISDNPRFVISGADGTFEPKQSLTVNILFMPTEEGIEQGTITFTSDDPDEPSVVMNISGAGVWVPVMNTSISELTSTLDINKSETQSIQLSNTGSGTLKWQVSISQSSQPGEEVPATSDFVELGSLPSSIISPALDPSTGSIYGYQPEYQIKGFSFYTSTWPAFGVDQFDSTIRGGTSILDSRMYVVYPDTSDNDIHVYTFPFAEWTSFPNELGTSTANITTDGTLLYLAGGGTFKSVHPKSHVWKTLAIPSINLNGLGGLSYHDGVIYAHEGGGTGFAKYDIGTGTWETLVSLPGDASLGSTIDTTRLRYYACGKNTLYEYDIKTKNWTPYDIPFFEVGDGGLVYQSDPTYEGIYFIQGTAGLGFAKFIPSDGAKWLRIAPVSSDIPKLSNEMIAINLNATSLKEGVYKGKVSFTANDPGLTTIDIPVALTVENPFPILTTPYETDATIGSQTDYEITLPIANDGRDTLIWNFTDLLPDALTADKTSGSVAGHSSDDIHITLQVSKVEGGIFAQTLAINSNDPKSPLTAVYFRIKLDFPPVVENAIPDQMLTTTAVEFQLSSIFRDPEGKSLKFHEESDNATVAGVSTLNDLVIITPHAVGSATITLTATDAFATTTSTINVKVNTVVGLEDPVGQSFTSSPNPFEKDVLIRYDVDNPVTSEVLLIDVSGRIVLRSGVIQEQHGMNELSMDGGRLSAGIYECVLLRNGMLKRSTRILKR
jgi:hypothetical protein